MTEPYRRLTDAWGLQNPVRNFYGKADPAHFLNAPIVLYPVHTTPTNTVPVNDPEQSEFEEQYGQSEADEMQARESGDQSAIESADSAVSSITERSGSQDYKLAIHGALDPQVANLTSTYMASELGSRYPNRPDFAQYDTSIGLLSNLSSAIGAAALAHPGYCSSNAGGGTATQETL